MILKKLIFSISVIATILTGALFLTPPTPTQACTLPDGGLLGIPPWYKYLEGEEVVQTGSGKSVCQPVLKADKERGGDSSLPKGDILLIAAAVLEILTRVAALAAFAYLIYGGFMYLSSSGNAEQVKKAGSTLLNAGVGLAIAISATTLINFFATRLGK